MKRAYKKPTQKFNITGLNAWKRVGKSKGYIKILTVGLGDYDTSTLYTEDVQLIAKDGKIYYLPEKNAR